jgi:molecular chaperone DnaK
MPEQVSAAPTADRAPESPLSRVTPLVGVAEGPIIGIDLGTTYSCVAFVKDSRPFVIPSRQGYNTIPSIVAITPRRKIIVGHPAKSQMVTNPTQTIFGAKRLIGRRFNSHVVKQVKERFHYEIIEGPAGEAAVNLGGTVFSLQQISAMILVEAREIAEQHLGRPVQRAVITVPAYYNAHQRQAVREAGALAGMQVERIINEPTAAALAFGYGRQLQKTILVYDLGGGTFDASLLKLTDNIYEVVSTGGNTFLGGVDFDNLIVDFLAAEFQKRTGTPFSGGPVGHQRLVDSATKSS